MITWTQQSNDAMRAVNEALGYEYRGVSLAMSRRFRCRDRRTESG